ncbi:tyrosine-type recombinase/integrase [Candidatus Riflebacteria bacterium]
MMSFSNQNYCFQDEALKLLGRSRAWLSAAKYNGKKLIDIFRVQGGGKTRYYKDLIEAFVYTGDPYYCSLTTEEKDCSSFDSQERLIIERRDEVLKNIEQNECGSYYVWLSRGSGKKRLKKKLTAKTKQKLEEKVFNFIAEHPDAFGIDYFNPVERGEPQLESGGSDKSNSESKVIIKAALEQFLEYKKSLGKRASTINGIRRSLRIFLELYPDLPFQDFTGKHMTQVRLKMQEPYIPINRKKAIIANPNTASRWIRDFNELVEWANKEGYIPWLRSFDGMDPAPPNKPPRIVPDEDFIPVYRYLKEADPHWACGIRLIRDLGLRPMCVRYMRYSWWDFKKMLLIIPFQEDDGFHLKDDKHRKEPFVISLRKRPDLIKGILSLKKRSQRYIFPAIEDVKKPRGETSDFMKKVFKATGIEPFTPTDLRHTFNSKLANANIIKPIRGKLLGHSEKSSLADTTYFHADKAALEEALTIMKLELD